MGNIFRNGTEPIDGKLIGDISASVVTIGFPVNLSAQEVAETSIALVWEIPAHTYPIANYKLYKNGILETTITDPQETGFDVTGLTGSTSYSFTMTAEDDQGNPSALSPPLVIPTMAPAGNTPVSSFQVTPDTMGDAPLAVNFESFSNSNSPDPITLHFWDYGDGNTKSGGTTASHTYTTAGTYLARLDITVLGIVYSSTQTIVVTTSGVLDTEPPTPSGKPIHSSSTQSNNSFSYSAATDNIGISEYDIFQTEDTSLAPNSEQEIHLAGESIANLDSSGVGFIQNTYPVQAGQQVVNPNGITMKFAVTPSFPNVVSERVEFREINNTSTIVDGAIKEYNARFRLVALPAILKAPVTIWQLFAQNLDAPTLELELRGDGQGNAGDANKIQVVDSFTGSGAGERYISPAYLQAENDIKVIVYFHATNGWFKVIVNDVVLREITGINTSADSSNRWSQFGLYPHGYHGQQSLRDAQAGDPNFELLMHSYTVREWTSTAPASGDFYGFDFNSAPKFSASNTSTTDTGLVSDSMYRYAVVAKDIAGNKSAPSLSDSFSTIPVGTSNYPTQNLIIDIPMWEEERSVSGSTLLDRSGNGNNLAFSGTLQDDGVLVSGVWTPDTWDALGNECTIVEVTRYFEAKSTPRQYRFNGIQNALTFDTAAAILRNNESGQKEKQIGFMAHSQPSWFHAHIVVIKSNGDAELYRSMLEPSAGWEQNSNTTLDHRDIINGRNIEAIEHQPGNVARHFMMYDAALSGQALADLQVALLTEHKSPHTGGVFPPLSNYNLLYSTNFAAVSDPATEFGGANMGYAIGNTRLERSSQEVYQDLNGVSKACIKMQFDNSHGGYGKRQNWNRWLEQSVNGSPVITNQYEEMIIEISICVTGLILGTSLGAKTAPHMNWGGTPNPCEEIPDDMGYDAMMNRPPRRNSFEDNDYIDGAVLHTYAYFRGALDPCGQHMHYYNPDGTFFILKPNEWVTIRRRVKLNDPGILNGILQTQINGVDAQSDGNMKMRTTSVTKLKDLSAVFFSGGDWSWDGSGYVRVGDVKIYVP